MGILFVIRTSVIQCLMKVFCLNCVVNYNTHLIANLLSNYDFI